MDEALCRKPVLWTAKNPRMFTGIRALILIPSQEEQPNAGSTLHRASSGCPRDVPQGSLVLMLHSSAQIKHSFAALLVQDLKGDSYGTLQQRYTEAIGKSTISLTLFFLIQQDYALHEDKVTSPFVLPKKRDPTNQKACSLFFF